MKEEEASLCFDSGVFPTHPNTVLQKPNITARSRNLTNPDFSEPQVASDNQSPRSSKEVSSFHAEDEAVGVANEEDDGVGNSGNLIHKPLKPGNETESEDSEEIQHQLDKLFQGSSRAKKERQADVDQDRTPKVGAAKAKRLKRAEKQAALEAEGGGNAKTRKSNRPYDAGGAIQKARGETATTGKRISKKR
jgi:hypothetical protein